MAGATTTWTRHLSQRDAEAYDRFVDEARGGSYAQARAWAKAAVAGRRFAVRWFLTRREGRVLGAGLVLRPRAVGPFLAPAAILERGPVCAEVSDLPAVLGALRRAALARGVVRLQVMPYFAGDDAERAEALLADTGFRSVHTFTSAHARSLRLDLEGKDEAGLFPASELKRELRRAERAGATGRRGGRAELSALERLCGELMRAQGHAPKPHSYFEALGPLVDEGRRAAVFVCEHDGAVMGAMLVMRHGDVATYVMGASTTERRPFPKTAPAAACAIRWAQAEGCRTFDMGGIPMEGDTDEKRRSIAAFKHTFATRDVRLVREHARWL